MASLALEALRDGDIASAIAHLKDDLAEHDRRDSRGAPPTDHLGDSFVYRALTEECLAEIERGDIGEAALRLERRDHPKWHRISECQKAYRKAMAAKRGGIKRKHAA